MLVLFTHPSTAGIQEYALTREEIRIIPEDLYQYAAEHRCLQVSNFFRDRPEVRDPPYVYGVLTGGARDFSAAFWCERTDVTDNKFVLLLKLDGHGWPEGCPSRIDSQDFAGGLSIVRSLHEPLEWYWNMKDETPVGKPGEIASGLGIQSLYDGTGNIYYCHDGEWVARPLE
jgi:hypothetical protein